MFDDSDETETRFFTDLSQHFKTYLVAFCTQKFYSLVKGNLN